MFQASQCGSNSDCPTFGRRKCVGPSLGICLGKVEYSTVTGRCVRRGSLLCKLAAVWSRNTADCDFRRCAECLKSIDCTGYRQVCCSLCSVCILFLLMVHANCGRDLGFVKCLNLCS